MDAKELLNDEYGHCGECHEVHHTSKMVEIDGYLYCKKCANPTARSIGEMHQQSAARIASLEADNAKLIAALGRIRMIASCAPHDDEELASQEFTTIMNEARAVLAEVTK
jgi:NAD-dependent SIR2 family protein deacetylase